MGIKTIVEPAAEPVSLEMARKQCKVDAEGSPPTHEDDDLIQAFTTAAREWCEAYTGRTIAKKTLELALDEFPEADILIESGPVAGIESITYIDEDGAEQTVDSASYTLDQYQEQTWVIPAIEFTWPATLATVNAVKVRFAAGYTTDTDSPNDLPLPKSIQIAILLLLGHLYENRSNTTDQALTAIPFGVTAFLSPLKLRKGFA